MATAHVVVLLSALLGWSDITIQPSRGDRGFSSFQHSVAGIDRPSERTLETLKRYDLERPYRRPRNVNNVLLILAAQSKDPIDPQGVIKLKVHGHEQVLQVVLRNSPWTPADVHKLILASDFEVSGLATSHNQYGLGVPLIGVRVTDPKKDERPPQERFYPDEMAFPLTAFLVPNSRLRDSGETVDEARKCTLELKDPVRERAVGQPPNRIALEIDLTTPLAYMWSRTDLDRYRWSGLLRPEQALQRANLLMIRPYEPGKIPVVMVHGLISTPLAWIPMLNELLRDPSIQEHYQFMLYMYPTGVPMPIAAANLRDALSQAKMTFNPDG